MQEEKMKGKDPCWKGYKMLGTKKKAGKNVPNCIPESGFVEPSGVSPTTGLDLNDLSSKEPVSKNKNKSASRFWGTKSLANIYKKDTPGQHNEEVLTERGEDSKGYYRSTESGAGLTRKGAKHFGIHTAVTGKVKPGSKAANRRASFCARMSGMPGPMKDEKGRPTRKAASLRRWRCRT